MKNKTLNLMLLWTMVLSVCANAANGKEPSKRPIATYQISGACTKTDISSNTNTERDYHFDFIVGKSTNPIKSIIGKCPTSKLQDLAEFSRKEAEAMVALGEDESFFWRIQKIKSLKPISCGILRNPDSDNAVVIIKYEVNAAREKNIAGNTLLAIVRTDSKIVPKETLTQYIGNETDNDNMRDVSVGYICDLDSDGLVEVILKDDRYAGSGFWVERFADDLSAMNSESVDHVLGD